MPANRLHSFGSLLCRTRRTGLALGSGLLLFMLLGGCGFEPLYAQKGAYSNIAELRKIAIAAPSDRTTQILRNQLIAKLNPSGKTDYRLLLDVSSATANLAIERDSRVTRANYRLTATYQLIDIKTQVPIADGKASASASYNKVASEFANQAAEENARRRTAQTVANQLILQLGVALRQEKELGKESSQQNKAAEQEQE